MYKPTQLAAAVEYTNYISAEEKKTPPLPSTSFLDMTLNKLVGDAPILVLWGMWSIPSLPLLLGPL